MWYALFTFAGTIVLAIVVVVRRRRFRARRLAVKREVRKFWEKHRPGELYPECPVCRLPFPASFPDCPFCNRSRIRARVLRRDVDWALETGGEDLEVRLLRMLGGMSVN